MWVVKGMRDKSFLMEGKGEMIVVKNVVVKAEKDHSSHSSGHGGLKGRELLVV
jgi:hypothetical protein